MTENDDISESHFKDWRTQINKNSEDSAAFLSYFDTVSSAQESLVQGAWDFAHHILKPRLIPLIGSPFEARALEIGFGGGRLLTAACRYFEHVYGVDIHDQIDKVQEILAMSGVTNATLLSGDGKTIPLDQDSVDFVYSFIVLQHLPTLEILEGYLDEVKRVLRPGKPACLYVGHLEFNLRGIDHMDMNTRSVDTSRENTLLLRPSLTRKLMRRHGLSVIETGRHRKKPWVNRLGNQHFVIVTA